MSKSGSMGWMLVRIMLIVVLAVGVFGAVIYKTMQDEEALIQQENVDARFREYDPSLEESRGGPPPGAPAGGGERRRRPRPAANENEAPAADAAPATNETPAASEARAAETTPATEPASTTESAPAAEEPKPESTPAE